MTAHSPAAAGAAAGVQAVAAPADASRMGRALRTWLLAYWAIIAVLRVSQDVYFNGLPSGPGPLLRVTVGNVAAVGVWIGVCVLAFRLTRRRTTFGLRDVLRVATLAVVLSVCNQAVQDFLQYDVIRPGSGHPLGRFTYAWLGIPNTIAITVNIFAVAWTVRTITLSRENRARANVARTELFLAQTRALERQLRPHFLFNTLQSVTTLIHRDAAAARRMLLGLRSLLEHSIASGSRLEISLAEELRIIRLYLDIETLRFSRQLDVGFSIDPEALRAAIPPFLLQPLVENAVHHAVAIRGEGRIVISAGVTAGTGRLDVAISDTGAGTRPAARSSPPGIGLRNTRTRLQILYGENWDLRLRPTAGGGSAVEVSLPFRPTHVPPQAGEEDEGG